MREDYDGENGFYFRIIIGSVGRLPLDTVTQEEYSQSLQLIDMFLARVRLHHQLRGIALMPVNFQEILSRPVESAERPKARPQGTYRCRVGKYETGESTNKKTPYIRHFLHPVAAMEDVDMERLEANGGLRTEKPLRGDFYLTDDALYRYREFLSKLGLTVEGRSFSECILEAENCEVLVYLIEEPGELPANADPNEPPPMYNRIDSYARVA